MTLQDKLFEYILPGIIVLIFSAYALMFKFVRNNKISLEPLTKSFWFDFRIGHYMFELPSKYTDAYREKYGKSGPGIKLLILGMSLFFLFWVIICLSVIYELFTEPT